jgi:hypothetical protein
MHHAGEKKAPARPPALERSRSCARTVSAALLFSGHGAYDRAKRRGTCTLSQLNVCVPRSGRGREGGRARPVRALSAARWSHTPYCATNAPHSVHDARHVRMRAAPRTHRPGEETRVRCAARPARIAHRSHTVRCYATHIGAGWNGRVRVPLSRPAVANGKSGSHPLALSFTVRCTAHNAARIMCAVGNVWARAVRICEPFSGLHALLHALRVCRSRRKTT